MSHERLEAFKLGIGSAAMHNMEMVEDDAVMELLERSVTTLLELQTALREGNGADRKQVTAFVLGMILARLSRIFDAQSVQT